VSEIIFGSNGIECLVVPMIGAVVGFVLGNKIQDNREQKRINRELEQDRLNYEQEKPS